MVASSLGVGDPKGEVQRPRDLTVNSANQHRRGAADRRLWLDSKAQRARRRDRRRAQAPYPARHRRRRAPYLQGGRPGDGWPTSSAANPGRSIGRPPRPSWTPSGREGLGWVLTGSRPFFPSPGEWSAGAHEGRLQLRQLPGKLDGRPPRGTGTTLRGITIEDQQSSGDWGRPVAVQLPVRTEPDCGVSRLIGRPTVIEKAR